MTPSRTILWLIVILVCVVLMVWLSRVTRARVKQGVVTQSQVDRARLRGLLFWFIIVIAIVVGWYALHR